MENKKEPLMSAEDVKLKDLLNDAILNKKKAENQIREWQIKLNERLRVVTTIEIIIGKATNNQSTPQ